MISSYSLHDRKKMAIEKLPRELINHIFRLGSEENKEELYRSFGETKSRPAQTPTLTPFCQTAALVCSDWFDTICEDSSLWNLTLKLPEWVLYPPQTLEYERLKLASLRPCRLHLVLDTSPLFPWRPDDPLVIAVFNEMADLIASYAARWESLLINLVNFELSKRILHVLQTTHFPVLSYFTVVLNCEVLPADGQTLVALQEKSSVSAQRSAFCNLL
jgi:hypothetical protein